MALSYRAFHWGRKGSRRDERLAVAVVKRGDELRLLGELAAVVYETEKGIDGAPTQYEHKFARPLPRLYEHGPSGRLVIAGGRYRIEARGIVDNAARGDTAAPRVGPRARLVLLGDLVAVTLAHNGIERALPRPRPRLAYHGQTGLLVVAGGKKHPLK